MMATSSRSGTLAAHRWLLTQNVFAVPLRCLRRYLDHQRRDWAPTTLPVPHSRQRLPRLSQVGNLASRQLTANRGTTSAPAALSVRLFASTTRQAAGRRSDRRADLPPVHQQRRQPVAGRSGLAHASSGRPGPVRHRQRGRRRQLPPLPVLGHIINQDDWTQGATFTGDGNSQLIPIASFTPACNGGYGGDCVPQKGITDKDDSLGDRLMYRFAYWNDEHLGLRSTGSSTSTSPRPASQNGVRWMEFTAVPTVVLPSNLSVFQQGTCAPDGNWRWMGSLTRDKVGDILLGYSESCGTTCPGAPRPIRRFSWQAALPATPWARWSPKSNSWPALVRSLTPPTAGVTTAPCVSTRMVAPSGTPGVLHSHRNLRLEHPGRILQLRQLHRRWWWRPGFARAYLVEVGQGCGRYPGRKQEGRSHEHGHRFGNHQHHRDHW